MLLQSVSLCLFMRNKWISTAGNLGGDGKLFALANSIEGSVVYGSPLMTLGFSFYCWTSASAVPLSGAVLWQVAISYTPVVSVCCWPEKQRNSQRLSLSGSVWSSHHRETYSRMRVGSRRIKTLRATCSHLHSQSRAINVSYLFLSLPI